MLWPRVTTLIQSQAQGTSACSLQIAECCKLFPHRLRDLFKLRMWDTCAYLYKNIIHSSSAKMYINTMSLSKCTQMRGQNCFSWPLATLALKNMNITLQQNCFFSDFCKHSLLQITSEAEYFSQDVCEEWKKNLGLHIHVSTQDRHQEKACSNLYLAVPQFRIVQNKHVLAAEWEILSQISNYLCECTIVFFNHIGGVDLGIS